MDELLKLENIYFRYENEFVALNDVSVTFHKGERVAILGNNGAGKSTFFLCCNGVLHPEKGEIYLKGEKLSHSKKDVYSLRQTVGLVFQEPDTQIIAGTVENEVSFGPMNLKLDYEEVENRVDQALSQMNIEKYRNYAPQYLSGGEKKRVSIADILAMRPEMILFDEPTASLDPENVEVLEETLSALSREGITIVISTHDVDFAYRFAERFVIFSRGEVIADASPEEVLASDEVIQRAGLKKPSLYDASELLEKQFPNKTIAHRPKNLEEFGEYVSELASGN